MSMTIKCGRCGTTMTGRDECSAEILWTVHVCPDLRPLSELAPVALKMLAMGEITEEVAWAMTDGVETPNCSPAGEAC